MATAVTASLAALYRALVWDEASFDLPLAEGSSNLDARDKPLNSQVGPPTTTMDDEPMDRRHRSVRFALEAQRHSNSSMPQDHGNEVGQEGPRTAHEPQERTGDSTLELNIQPNPQEVERTRRKLRRSIRRGERLLALKKAKEASAAQRQALKAAKRAADWAAEKAANGTVNRAAVEAAWTPEQQQRITASRAAYEAHHQAWFEARPTVYAGRMATLPPSEERRAKTL